MGNGEVRPIASGLQKLIPIDQMKDQLVVVVCNLKERKLADYMSQGMILCAETPDRQTAELLRPPEGAVPGDLVTFPGYERKCPEVLPAKKSPYDTVAPKFVIDETGVAKWDTVPFTVEGKGVCTSLNIKKGEIH